jgi:putative ABC transport system substrate-binding protein
MGHRRQRGRQLTNLRNLTKLVAIIVLTWPIRVNAQPAIGTRHVGVLMYLKENDPESKIYLDAFVQSLQKLGWTVGRNLRIDYRWNEGDAERASMRVNSLLLHLT